MAGRVSFVLRSGPSGIDVPAYPPHVLERTTIPYRTPRAGSPLRLAFVGQATFFEAASLDERSARVHTTFIEFRENADAEPMRAALDAFAPHVVVVFRPEIVPAGALDGLRAAT